MTIVRWDSSRDVAALQERMSRMLEGFYVRPQEDVTRGAWVPAVDPGKVNAEYKAGLLTVRLPLREEAKPKQIKVAVAVAA